MNTETITFVLAELERAERRIAIMTNSIKDAEKTIEAANFVACEIQAQVNGLRVLLTVEKNAAQKGK